MNAEIEHASPHGKAPGEKVPGERKKLGAAAARALCRARAQAASSSPEADQPLALPPQLPVQRLPVHPGVSAAAYAVLFIGLWRSLRRRS